MKKPIFKYLIAIFIFLSFVQVFAQAEKSKTGSRLNMAQQKQTTRSSIQRATILGYVPSFDRNIAPKRSTALNTFYRSILLPNTNSTTASAPKSSPAVESVSPSTDNRLKVAEDLRNEDKMFVNDRISVSNVFPNPANDFAEINYQISGSDPEARVTLYSVLHNEVGEYQLNKGDNRLRISTRDLPTGIYFYQLVVDGKKVATKKLLVRH